MAVSISNVTKDTFEGSFSSHNTASVTPTGNNLELLTVASRTGITANPNQPTISGNGLTWVLIDSSVVYDNSSSSRRRVSLFRAMGASPSTGAITIDFGGQTQTSVFWSLDEASGVDTSGTNGSGAIVQSATNLDASGTATSLTVTLAAFSDTNNATFGAFGFGDSGQTQTVGTGFTALANIYNGAVAQIGGLTEWKSSNDTTVDVSTGGVGVELGGIAIEIKAAAAVVAAQATGFMTTNTGFWGT